MAWKQVEKYILGYNLKKNQFYFYYKLEGETVTNQIFPSPEIFMALADMFRNEGPINYNTTGGYFVTASEQVGEEESHPK